MLNFNPEIFKVCVKAGKKTQCTAKAMVFQIELYFIVDQNQEKRHTFLMSNA